MGYAHHPGEALALLSPRTTSDQREGSWEAVAWGLAGLYRHHYLAARLRGAQDMSVVDELVTTLGDGPVGAMANQGRWRRKERQPHRLADLAVMETAYPAMFRFDVERYLYAGFDRKAWQRCWKLRYVGIFRLLNHWADQGESNLKRRIPLPHNDPPEML